MSRHHAFAYSVNLPEWDLLTHDQVCGTVIPKFNCAGGATAFDQVDFWLWANPTKARRLAGRLDEHFGTTGTLTLLDPE